MEDCTILSEHLYGRLRRSIGQIEGKKVKVEKMKEKQQEDRLNSMVDELHKEDVREENEEITMLLNVDAEENRQLYDDDEYDFDE